MANDVTLSAAHLLPGLELSVFMQNTRCGHGEDLEAWDVHSLASQPG